MGAEGLIDAAMSLREKLAQLVGLWAGADPDGGEVAPHQNDMLGEPVAWAEAITAGLGRLTRPPAWGASFDPELGAEVSELIGAQPAHRRRRVPHVMKAFFESLPNELEEAAAIDGLSAYGILQRVVLPLSKAVIATMVLFYAVANWNSWFSAFLYVDRLDLFPVPP
ncbi:ABC transporter permease subunit [Actinokineospora guangxiensis]|uniref:ABC transporter permease subunit n=1 Tax=Actinokineospora guangxiensis TaxID=1490288 RepID=A0ABW0ERC1_9PSEU